MPSSALRYALARPVVAVPLLAALAASTQACTVIHDLSREQCTSDSDCRQRGGPFVGSICRNSVCEAEPTWGCLGNVTWPPPEGTGTVTAKLILTDLTTSAPVTDATARSCQKIDTKCESPVASDFRSDAEGVLSVQVEKHFDGFIEITAPGKISPLLYFFYPPLDADRTIPYVPLVSFDVYTTLADQVGGNLDFTRGAAIALSHDCQGLTAPGTEFSVDEADENTLPFFMQKGLPSLTATETDSSGQGGFINVKPGIRRVTGSVKANGGRIGTVSVVVRPNLITYTMMVPSPE